MSLKDKLIKIENHIGLYFKNDKNMFDGVSITVNEIQKKVKPPFTIVLKFYNGKKLKLKQIHIADNRHTVKRVCDELQAQRNTTQIEKSFKSIRPKQMTFQELFMEFHEQSQAGERWKAERILYINKHLAQLFDKPIDKIETNELQTICNNLYKTLSPRSVDTAKQIVRAIFNYAIKRKYVQVNPAKDIEIKSYDNKIYFGLSDEKAEKFYEIIRNLSPINKAIFAFLVNGRRKGETLKMRWEWIDFDNKAYDTPATITKADKNFRYPLTNDLLEALLELGVEKNGYIFPGATVNEHRKDVRSPWEQIKKEAGIEKMRLHDMRHLIGYRASKAKLPLHAISKALGHSSIQSTMRYANVDTDMVADLLNIVKDTSKKSEK